MNKKIAGVLPALLAPVDESGRTDFALLKKQTSYLVDAGAHGIFANGSTAESPYTTTREKIDILRAVQDAVAGRVPVYTACIQPSTDLVLQEIDAITPEKPDFIVVTTPFYYDVNQAAILEHFRTIAAHSEIPVVAYDIPSSTHNRVEFETMVQLPEINNLIGIKDSSGDFGKFSRAVRATAGSGFAWIQGDDFLDGVSLLIGASAVVTGTGNVSLDPYVRLYNAVVEGRSIDEITAIQLEIDALCRVFSATGQAVIPAIKAATSMLGRSTPYTRLPGMAVPQDVHPAIRQVLVSAGLLT